MMTIDLVRRQPRTRKVRPVRRIGPDLRLQAKRVGLAIEPPLSTAAAVEIVPRIELQAWLVGQQLQHPPRARCHHPRGKPHALAVPQAVIVIVAKAVAELPLVAADARAD